MSNQQFDNTNKGALFPSQHPTNGNYPDFRGQVNIDGKEYWLAGWKKNTDTHGEIISLSATPKDMNKAQPQESDFDHEEGRP